MDRQASGAERNPTTQSGEPQAGEQRTGEVVKLEVAGKLVECRIERVLDLEAPQVMLSVCRVIQTQQVVLRVVSSHGAATVVIGAVGNIPSKMMEAFQSLEEELDKQSAKGKRKALQRKKTRSTSVDRPARQRPAKSR